MLYDSGLVADRIHLDDLARPRLPWPLRAANALAAPLSRLLRLDEASLVAAARRRTRCDDLGDEAFLAPLRVLLGALEREAGLSLLGRFSTRAFLVQLLSNRLLVEDCIARHPEILDARIERPIIIAGLPRTGTTHLHNLIAADPTLRSLPLWEALEPVPRPGEPARPPPDDPRWQRCAQALRLQDWLMPEFKRMHEMTPDAIHEEIQLLAIDFSTMLFESSYRVPSYRAWYMDHDQTRAYRYLHRVLQVLQWLRGTGLRWTLKSPQHLEQMRALMQVFPDARVIQTHRDPVRITASLCTMLAYSSRMQARRVDPREIGRVWSRRIEDLLRGSIEGRRYVPPDQIFDVRFDEFMKDDVAMVERVYAFAGQPWTPEARSAIRAYRDANPRGKHGTVEYRLDDVGLDADERRDALRFYTEAFDVTEEG
jgi:hypothetical protein